MDLGFKDRVALVTGTGSQIGMGRTIAVTLAKEGCDIVSADIDIEGAEKTAEEVKSLGRRAIAFKVDVASSSEVNEMVKAALAEFGKIDILVHAGAIRGPVGVPIADLSEQDIRAIFDVDLIGAFLI